MRLSQSFAGGIAGIAMEIWGRHRLAGSGCAGHPLRNGAHHDDGSTRARRLRRSRWKRTREVLLRRGAPGGWKGRAASL